jgi:hypothetical protein
MDTQYTGTTVDRKGKKSPTTFNDQTSAKKQCRKTLNSTILTKAALST